MYIGLFKIIEVLLEKYFSDWTQYIIKHQKIKFSFVFALTYFSRLGMYLFTMRLSIVSFFLICLCFGACQFTAKQNALHPSECKTFKEGVFYNEDKTYKVERIGNSQIEYDLNNQLSYHFEVHWLYDCAYNLTFKHSNNKVDTLGMKARDMLRIQLIETSDTSFTYEVDFKNNRFKNTLYKQ